MKKIFIFAMASLMMMSCSQTAVVSHDQTMVVD